MRVDFYRLSRCEVFVPKVAELIDGMHDGKEVLYRALRKCTLRSGRSLTSDSVGTLERGEEVRATKHACECPQRQKLNCPGWVPIGVDGRGMSGVPQTTARVSCGSSARAAGRR